MVRQFIKPKTIRRSNSYRPGVEELEIRELMVATLTAVNDGPFMMARNVPLTIDVLANDSNPNGGDLVIVNLIQGTKGIAAVNPDKTITYTPFLDALGLDDLSYGISNGAELSTATVSLCINAPPGAPPTGTAAEQSAADLY